MVNRRERALECFSESWGDMICTALGLSWFIMLLLKDRGVVELQLKTQKFFKRGLFLGNSRRLRWTERLHTCNVTTS
jgi:hypothetical protein